MSRSQAASLAALVALLTCTALVEPAAAQEDCPPPQLECGPGGGLPPTIILSPQSGTYPSGGLALEIGWSGNTYSLDATSVQILVGSQDVTSQFTHSFAAGTEGSSSGTLTLAPGTTHYLSASICSIGGGCATEYAAYTGAAAPPPPASVEVTPHLAAVERPAERSLAEVFVVRNTGTIPGTFVLMGVCSGMQVTGCQASRSSATLGAGDSTTVAVTYATSEPGLFGGGEVLLKAWNGDAVAVRDSGSYTVQLTSPPWPVASHGPGELGDNTRLDRADCVVAAAAGAAYECGDLRLAHALPGTRVLNRARAPTLVYSSQHARPHPIVAIPFTPAPASGWPAPHVQEVHAVVRIGAAIVAQKTWTGLSIPTDFHSHAPPPVYRFALGFDTQLPTGAYDYQVEVTATYSDATVEGPDLRTGTLVVVNRIGSPFGAGWWVAGVEELHVVPGDTASRLWVGGDGSHRIYRRVSATEWAADAWARPEVLRWEPATGEYVRELSGGAEVRFDAAGRHVRTVNGAGQWSAFEWSSGKLVRIHLPRTPHFDSGYSYLLEYLNPGGRLSRVVPPGMDRPVVVGMDGGRVTSFTGPDAYGVGFTYTGPNLVPSSRVDRRGVATTFALDAGMRLARITNTMATADTADDIALRFRAAESQGLDAPVAASDVFTRIDGPRTDVVDHTRIWLGRTGAPVRVQNALGHLSVVLRDDPAWPGRVTGSLTPSGVRSTATFDARGNVVTQTQWNPFGDGRNATTIVRYDPACPDHVAEVTAPTGEIVRAGYDPARSCNRIWQEDGRGASTRTEFRYYAPQVNGGLMRAVDGPATIPDSLTYDARGNLAAVQNASGARTAYENDAIGRVTATVTRVAAATSSAPEVVLRTETWFDVMDRDTTTVTFGDAGEGNAQVRKRFDAAGNVLSVARRSSNDMNGIGWITTHWRYDAAGRVVAEIPTDSIWGGSSPYLIKDSTRYDPAGNAVEVVTRRGHAIHMQYDALNRLTQRTIPEVRYPYSQAPNEPTFPHHWNEPDQSYLVPGDVETFSYDDTLTKTGQLVQAANRDAIVRRSYYPGGRIRGDTLRISTWVGTDFTQHVYGLEFGYDVGGRRTSLLHPDRIAPRLHGTTAALRTQSYAYDPYVGQLASVTNPMGTTFGYEYDVEGRLGRHVSPGGVEEVFTYDAAGRLSRRQHYGPNGAGGTRRIHDDAYEYDLRGKITRVSPVGMGSQQRELMEYSGLGALRDFDSRIGQPDAFHLEEFTTDALGNAYESRSRPYVETVWNVIRNVYEPGTGRRYKAISMDNTQTHMYADTVYAYDESGNIVRQGSQRGAASNWTHQAFSHSYYGADQRLRAVDRRTCSIDLQQGRCRYPSEMRLELDPGVFEEYRYDALGRRVALRTRREHQCIGNGCSSAVQRIVWDGDQVLYEIRAPGAHGITPAEMENDTTTLRWVLEAPYGRVMYTHALGIDQPVSLVRMGYTWGNGTRPASEPLTGAHEIVLYSNWRGSFDGGSRPDGSGNLPSATDLQGTLAMEIAWPASNHRAFLGQRKGLNWRSWMGGQLDQQRDATGLLYRRNRYYDPASGRFTQEDPIGLAGGVNLYGYANGDPINFNDPYGLCKVEVQFTPAGVIGKHAAIITTEPDGAAIAWDAGPARGPSSGGSAVGASGGASGSSSQGSGSNSGSANSSSPGAGETGGSRSMYGHLRGKRTRYEEGEPIYQPNAPRTVLVDDDQPCTKFVRAFEAAISRINDADIVYNPFTTNSNAAARYMLHEAGFTTVERPWHVLMPGWNRSLFPR